MPQTDTQIQTYTDTHDKPITLVVFASRVKKRKRGRPRDI